MLLLQEEATMNEGMDTLERIAEGVLGRKTRQEPGKLRLINGKENADKGVVMSLECHRSVLRDQPCLYV